MKKPQKNWLLGKMRYHKSHAMPCRIRISAPRTKRPAAAPIPAPLASFVTFCVISALASSISSRTSSDAFSETSWTAWAIWVCSGSAAKALEQHRGDQAAGERGADEDLGLLGGRGDRGRRSVERGRRLRVRRRAGARRGVRIAAHSGGSSPNARR